MIRHIVQRLMREAPRGLPMDEALLDGLGVSMSMASYLARQGWLYRLSRGVFLLTGDRPTRDGTIVFLSRKIPGLHVGGKTALDWRGVRHNIAFRQRVLLWGTNPYKFPKWVGEVMLYAYQTTRLFDDALPSTVGLAPVPGGHKGVLVSTTERALLELASEIGRGQSMEEALNLMVTLRHIRTPVLDELLTHCIRPKVARLARDLGRESGFEWGLHLQKHVDRLCNNKRCAVATSGDAGLAFKP